MSGNRWIQKIEENPDHSSWYVERFRKMEAEGVDLGGEARLIDAMVPKNSRLLDAGCGPGRVGGRLGLLGHDVVGVDIDPVLIVAAEQDHPGPTWLVADLAALDLPSLGVENGFDVAVCAGNVMGFLDPETRRAVLESLARTLNPGGRIVTGFGSGGDYPFADFFGDVGATGLVVDLALSSWDLQPPAPDSDFLVAVLSLPV